MTLQYDPDRQHRRSIRLPGYDYTQAGAYFVTVCTYDRTCLFGEIANGEVCLSDAGRVVQMVWEDIPTHFPHVELDAFIVMPNHVHGVILIASDTVGPTHSQGATHASPLLRPSGPQPRSLGAIVGAFKSAATKRINALRGTPGAPVWQRNYYEHIIRDDYALQRTRQYIVENPARWAEDAENPALIVGDAGGVGATHASPLHASPPPRQIILEDQP